LIDQGLSAVPGGVVETLLERIGVGGGVEWVCVESAEIAHVEFKWDGLFYQDWPVGGLALLFERGASRGSYRRSFFSAIVLEGIFVFVGGDKGGERIDNRSEKFGDQPSRVPLPFRLRTRGWVSSSILTHIDNLIV